LQEQKSLPPGLTDFLISLRHDAVQPLVLQDYALQQMAPWYQKVNATDKQRVITELESAAQETDKSYAGTALLALRRIEQENPGIRVASITNSVMELITKDSANLLARITALQLSGQMELPETRESIRRIAGDNSAPETLRISAVASLGSVTDQGTREFLKELADGSDPRLKQAAVSALKNDSVQKRNSGFAPSE
jgi:HEAT repeat protein